MLDHVGLEVSDLERSARFYDAVLGRLGLRRIVSSPSAVAYGSHEPRLWIVARGRGPAPGFGHIAISAAGRAAVEAAHAAALEHGGRQDGEGGAPAPRPEYGRTYFAAYVRDPDDLRVELVAAGR
jgi:catechol 2,3-dioxygenase-like lactoylglutathione lyase family enzyme